jgi:phage shock protein PspC (stress-responsive transcriptional regulator)
MSSNDNRPQRSGNATVILGVLLIALGILFFIGQVLDINFGRLGEFGWPVFIIAPGILLFLLALAVGERAGELLAILGSSVTTVGAILLYQNTFDYFQSWAYAWALVFPTSIGVGQIIYGSIKNREGTAATGIRLTVAGLIIFVALAVFFELVIGFSGHGISLSRFGWPALLIALGALVLVGRYLRLDRMIVETGIRRAKRDRWILGVCGGIAHHYGWNSNLVRAVTVLLAIFFPLPVLNTILVILGYALLGALLPETDQS